MIFNLEKLKEQSGISLLETVVSLALFSTVMLLMTAIFQLVVDGQRSAIASQNVQESLRYAFETMTKEIRNARLDTCTAGPTNKQYNVETTPGVTSLSFVNKNGECVIYTFVLGGRLLITRNDGVNFHTYVPVFPSQVKISDFDVIVDDNPIGSIVNSKQARVTIRMDVEAAVGKPEHKSKMRMQTTISTRSY